MDTLKLRFQIKNWKTDMNDGTDSKINVLKFSIDPLFEWILGAFRPGIVGQSPSPRTGWNELNLPRLLSVLPIVFSIIPNSWFLPKHHKKWIFRPAKHILYRAYDMPNLWFGNQPVNTESCILYASYIISKHSDPIT